MKYFLSILFCFSLFFSQGEALDLDKVIESICYDKTEAECYDLICFSNNLPAGITNGAFCFPDDEKEASAAFNEQVWRIINTISILAGAIAILMISLAGFQMITSLGDDDLDKAKESLGWSIGALLIIIFAYVIIYTFIGSIYDIGAPPK